MRLQALVLPMFLLASALPAFATVSVSSPANGATTAPTVPFVATANATSCSRGVASMGVYVDNNLSYVTNGANLNASLALPTGRHQVVVQSWDYCGGASTAPLELTVTNQTGVTVSQPANQSTVSSPVTFVSSATTACGQGVSAMGIYVDNQLLYVGNGSSLSTQVAMGGGQHNVVVQEWDRCGGAEKTSMNLTVGGTTIPNIHANGNWNQWGELAPIYDICNQCDGLSWSMVPHQGAISTSGNSTQFNIGGSTPYSDVLWSNPVLGQGNTQGRTDSSHSLLGTLHHFTLDTDVYITNLAVTQDLEFDINWYGGGVGMEWGTECNHLADGQWDLWDNVNARWFASGVPCKLNDKAWNHVTLQVQRQNNNDLLYQTLTVNGTTYTLNVTVAPFGVPAAWWGMTVNYQMDGNYKMSSNTTYLDKTNFTYW